MNVIASGGVIYGNASIIAGGSSTQESVILYDTPLSVKGNDGVDITLNDSISNYKWIMITSGNVSAETESDRGYTFVIPVSALQLLPNFIFQNLGYGNADARLKYKSDTELTLYSLGANYTTYYHYIIGIR